MDEFEWLLFITQLPAKLSSLRARVRVRLREVGALSLNNGTWIMPNTRQDATFLQHLLAYIRQNQGSGQILISKSLESTSLDEIITRFKHASDRELARLLKECAAFMAEIDEQIQSQKYASETLVEDERSFERLRKWSVKIHKSPFLNADKSPSAIAAIRNCRQKLSDYTRLMYAYNGFVTPIDEGFIAQDDLLDNS